MGKAVLPMLLELIGPDKNSFKTSFTDYHFTFAVTTKPLRIIHNKHVVVVVKLVKTTTAISGVCLIDSAFVVTVSSGGALLLSKNRLLNCSYIICFYIGFKHKRCRCNAVIQVNQESLATEHRIVTHLLWGTHTHVMNLFYISRDGKNIFLYASPFSLRFCYSNPLSERLHVL